MKTAVAKKTHARANAARIVKTAHVGWTHSLADRKREDLVADYEKHSPAFARPTITHDAFFDLSYRGKPNAHVGCDFLTDTHAFDIIVLHWIFAGWDGLEKNLPDFCSHFVFSLSPQHSQNAWQHRLAISRAKRIYVFGDANEVSATWLGNIEGYAAITTRTFTINEKIPT